MSTSSIPRDCETCGTTFVGPGTLCQEHRGEQFQTRGEEIAAAQAHSAAIITAREVASRRPRTEWLEELD